VVIQNGQFGYNRAVHFPVAPVRASIAIDPSSSLPLHRQIYEAWRDGILAGRFAGGERVPSSRDLADSLGTSRSTVTQAYEQLVAEGYLETARGAGTFVSAELPDELRRPPPVVRTQSAGASAIRLSRLARRLRDDFEYPPRPAGFINFSQVTPDLDEFPFDVWHRLLNRHLRRPDHDLFDYARDPHGHEPLRRQIAAYVVRSRAVSCAPDQVVVLNGSQQALDFAARLLLEPGDPVGFENPGYLGTRRVFSAYGARLLPVPVDGEGLVVDALDDRSRLVYVTPSHQFPTGVSMSLPRRLALLDWARRRGAVIIEDDYDSEYRYRGPPLPALQGLVEDAPVIYCGSFSKVMFPALRVGYAVLPRVLVPLFRRLKWLADRHSPALEQAALTDFLAEGHLERHIRRTRRLYGRRREVLVDALARHFGSGAQVLGDAAGMHVMVRFDDADVVTRARRHQVQLIDAGAYYLDTAPAGAFVMGFAALGERAIREGVRRLC
jgi:GntR family transcriptional regulator/MocR family aminotransferase